MATPPTVEAIATNNTTRVVFTGSSPIFSQISDSNANSTVPPKKPPKKIAFPKVVVPQEYNTAPAARATIPEISSVCVAGISNVTSDLR